MRYLIIKRMKFLVFSQYYYPESFSITVICEHLAKLGHTVEVITGMPHYGKHPSFYEDSLPQQHIINNVKIHRISTVKRGHSMVQTLAHHYDFYKKSMRYFKTLPPDYDVVLSMSLSPLMSISSIVKYARKNHIPHLLYCVDLWPESLVATTLIRPKGILYRVLNRWSRKIYQSVDQIIVGSPSYRDYLINHHQLLNVSETVMIQPALPLENKAVVHYPKGLNIVYTGHIGHIQQLDRLIHTLVKLPHNIHLHFIGTGQYLTTLQREVKLLNLVDQVHFYGHQLQENLLSYIEQADALFVGLAPFGVVGHTIPHKLIQYLASGKPIISMLTGDGRALLEQIGGNFVAEMNESSLVDHINKLSLLTEEEKRAIGDHNRAYYIKNLNKEMMVNKLLDQINLLIQSPSN
jgi:glycosyltransferase involved in cell wall biosynthesis